MPSHLTRQIFRRLIANEPIVYRGCLRRRLYSSCSQSRRTPTTVSDFNGRCSILYEQRRTFLNFNFFHRKERVEKDADMDPGLEKMMELAKRERMRARMPPIADVARALKDFFASKRKRKSPITDNQASLVLQSLRYYLAEDAKKSAVPPPENDERVINDVDARRRGPLLQIKLLRTGAAALFLLPDDITQSHVDLAKLLYDALLSLGDDSGARLAFVTYVRALSVNGQPSDAKRVTLEFESILPKLRGSAGSEQVMSEDRAEEEMLEQEHNAETTEDARATGGVIESYAQKTVSAAWIKILEGFVREGNATEVQDVLSNIEKRELGSMHRVALIMVGFCISQNDIGNMQQWWDRYQHAALHHRQPNELAAAPTLHRMLNWCLEHNKLEVGHEIVKDLMKTNPPKRFWDAVLVWAAGTGKGVDEIDRMMGVMERSNQSVTDELQLRIPDIGTVNALVEFAVKRKDPYMAERFITLGQSRNIEPNARTYVLQMEYRLSVDDVDGALIAYKSLQSMDTSSNEDLPTVNKLVVALCKTQRHDFDTIMNVTADLSDRRARFEADTVAVLTLLHLRRHEHTDVIDLLNTHAYHYSTNERDTIRDVILNLSLDPKTPTARAWNGYLIINDYFDETPRPQRTELMTSFMARERADMGVRIFQQMRAHSRLDTMPTIDTYVSAFLALAKIRELDSLEVVHNQLKLDYNVLPTTYLYNALMLSYIACGDADRGLNFWNDIVASKEGPSYNSIHIALRACEKTAFGDLKAREIWSLLRRRNVELDHTLWCSYLAALCGNGNVDQSLNVAEEAEAKGELVVDEFLLGSLCDSTPKYAEKQAMIEEWASDRYPEVWRKLQEVVGFETSATGTKKYKIDRRVSP